MSEKFLPGISQSFKYRSKKRYEICLSVSHIFKSTDQNIINYLQNIKI